MTGGRKDCGTIERMGTGLLQPTHLIFLLILALLLFGANVANLALAPQLIGMLSDIIAARSGAGSDSLRWALLLNTTTGLWAAYHFWAAGRRIRTDVQRAAAAPAEPAVPAPPR